MYYPKSQIQSNLSTNGKEYRYVSTKKLYTGLYYATADGKYFTGANPQDGSNEELIKLSKSLLPTETTNSESDFSPTTSRTLLPPGYQNSFKGSIPSVIKPKSEIILPTQSDYNNSEYQRYFLQQKVDKVIIEVSLSTYNRYLNEDSKVPFQLYTPIKINWILKGKPINTYNTNRNIVLLYESENEITGFYRSFKLRFLKYFKPDVNEYYSTRGGELKVENTNENYSGFYHVFPTRGVIMEGRFHTSNPHRILIPFKSDEIIETTISTTIGEVGTSIRRNIQREGGY